MARPKRNHSHFDVAVNRCAGMQSIDPQLDLGFGLTVKSYEEAITKFRTKLNAYNTALSQLDAQGRDLSADEKALQSLSIRMMGAIVGRFGKDSTEYQKAGGAVRTGARNSAKNPAEGSN